MKDGGNGKRGGGGGDEYEGKRKEDMNRGKKTDTQHIQVKDSKAAMIHSQLGWEHISEEDERHMLLLTPKDTKA